MNVWLQLLHPARLVKWALIAVIAAVVVVLGVFPVILGVLVSSSEDDAPVAGGCAPVGVPPGFTSAQWDTEQLANAAVIVERAQVAGVGAQGATVALATAMQESGMRNLAGGDRDSVGLFQQRPSTGWGTIKQINNPVLASDAFFGVATHTPNKGLTDFPQWPQISVTVAAQTVQASAFPDAYAKWEPEARDLAEQLYTEDKGSLLAGADLAQASQLCDSGIGGEATGDVKDVITAATDLLSMGLTYRLGSGNQNGPSGGSIDCSALTSSSWKAGAGIDIGRSAQDQWNNLAANRVTPADMQPGDLIFEAWGRLGPSGDSNSISHVAMYVGDGQMIEASRSKNGPTLSSARVDGHQFVGIARPPAQTSQQ